MNPKTIEALFPVHKGGLTLVHNPNAGSYRTVAEWLEDIGTEAEPDWTSPEARQRAIETESLWILYWYPDTLVGSYALAAPTLAEIFAGIETSAKRIP